MQKLISITLLLLLTTPCLRAQRKEISQARSYIKSGSNLKQAEDLMTGLLKDSANRTNPKIYDTWYQVVQKQYDIENEKLYLKQKCDTALIYQLTKKMFGIMVKLDSVDAVPDKKGRVRPKYRKDNAEIMDALRLNLFYGGTYNINKANFREAFPFFDVYIDCARQPLFTGYDYTTKDRQLVDAAYWATFCGYKAGAADETLKHSEMALQDSAKAQFTLSYIADAYRIKGDTAEYINALKDGFSRYPLFPYFFPRLQDYYTGIGQKEKALAITNEALKADPHSLLFLFAKSTVLLNMGRNQECVEASDSLIAVCDTIPMAYYNAGMACMNQVLVVEKNAPLRSKFKSDSEYREVQRTHKEELNRLYRQALPYMERYRQLSPQAKSKWAAPLYRIYFNLNMGKKFDEIDRIMKQK